MINEIEPHLETYITGITTLRRILLYKNYLKICDKTVKNIQNTLQNDRSVSWSDLLGATHYTQSYEVPSTYLILDTDKIEAVRPSHQIGCPPI